MDSAGCVHSTSACVHKPEADPGGRESIRRAGGPDLAAALALEGRSETVQSDTKTPRFGGFVEKQACSKSAWSLGVADGLANLL